MAALRLGERRHRLACASLSALEPHEDYEPRGRLAPGPTDHQERLRRAAALRLGRAPVFDGALLSGGGAVRVGAGSVPLVPLGQGGFDSVRVPKGRVRVELPDARLALRLHWDPHVLPHMHVWQERRSILGPPWFGRVDGVGLEPASHGPGDPEFGLGPLTLEPFGTLESLFRLEVIEAERGESPQPVEAAQ